MTLPEYKLNSQLLTAKAYVASSCEDLELEAISNRYTKEDRETFCRWVLGLIHEIDRQFARVEDLRELVDDLRHRED